MAEIYDMSGNEITVGLQGCSVCDGEWIVHPNGSRTAAGGLVNDSR